MNLNPRLSKTIQDYSQVVGFVAFDNLGSIVQIGDVNAINWISGANDMGDNYA